MGKNTINEILNSVMVRVIFDFFVQDWYESL